MAVASVRACTSSSAEYPSFAEALRAWRSREAVKPSRAQVEVPLSCAIACAVPCEPTVEVEAIVEVEATSQAIPEEISTCESTQLQVTLSSAPAAEEEETEADLKSDCDQTSAGSSDSKDTVSVSFSVSKSNVTSCSTGARVKVDGVDGKAWNARGGALAHQKPTASSMRQQQEREHAVKVGSGRICRELERGRCQDSTPTKSRDAASAEGMKGGERSASEHPGVLTVRVVLIICVLRGQPPYADGAAHDMGEALRGGTWSARCAGERGRGWMGGGKVESEDGWSADWGVEIEGGWRGGGEGDQGEGRGMLNVGGCARLPLPLPSPIPSPSLPRSFPFPPLCLPLPSPVPSPSLPHPFPFPPLSFPFPPLSLPLPSPVPSPSLPHPFPFPPPSLPLRSPGCSAGELIYVVDAACSERMQIRRCSDLPWAVGEEDLTHCLELRDLKGRSAMVMPVCAHDGTGVREGVTWLVEATSRCC
ncbi:unnamed protein product [Closterium sp. Yama58-4]|nr:unnamed protein product [Closterium sp. Yama58-4]